LTRSRTLAAKGPGGEILDHLLVTWTVCRISFPPDWVEGARMNSRPTTEHSADSAGRAVEADAGSRREPFGAFNSSWPRSCQPSAQSRQSRDPGRVPAQRRLDANSEDRCRGPV